MFLGLPQRSPALFGVRAVTSHSLLSDFILWPCIDKCLHMHHAYEEVVVVNWYTGLINHEVIKNGDNVSSIEVKREGSDDSLPRAEEWELVHKYFTFFRGSWSNLWIIKWN